jgi:hypothetical protein
VERKKLGVTWEQIVMAKPGCSHPWRLTAPRASGDDPGAFLFVESIYLI